MLIYKFKYFKNITCISFSILMMFLGTVNISLSFAEDGLVSDVKTAIETVKTAQEAAKMGLDISCYPRVRADQSISFPIPDLSSLDQNRCRDEYLRSQTELDKSIGDVARELVQLEGSTDSPIYSLIVTLTDKILNIYKAYLEVTPPKNSGSGISKDKKWRLLQELSSSLGDSVSDAGNLGSMSLSVLNSLEKNKEASKGKNLANLRLKLYFLYRSAFFLNNVIMEPLAVQKISKILPKDDVDIEVFKALREWDSLSSHSQGKPMFQYGAYAHHNREASVRVSRTEEEKKKYIDENLGLQDSDLTPAEVLRLTGELQGRIDPSALKKRVPWVFGKAFYKVNDESNSEFIKQSNSLGFPIVAGVSGTVDLFLAIGSLVHLSSPKDRELLRFALIGWMAPKDHSVHEIMTGSKSFSMSYKPRPDAYQDILSDINPELRLKFLKKLKQHHENKIDPITGKHFMLPEVYLQLKNCGT